MPPRVLILTASIGEGHDHPARMLALQLRAERPEVEIVTEDGLAVMGRAVVAVSEDAPRVVFHRFGWLWDLGYAFFARFGPTRRLGQASLTRFGAPGLLRLIARYEPDVVVSMYPQTTEVLGRLRRDGRLRIPLCAAVTDLAGLWYWATPGADVHLVTHVESIEEVHRVAGAAARVHCVNGFSDPAFLMRRRMGDARSALGLPAEGKVALVSGGGWGVGKLEVALGIALERPEIGVVVVLCGRNEELRARLDRRFAEDERVRVVGFTEEMPEWLAAADVLVHSTAGLTILEALIRGCPPISFGWGRGHIRVNNASFRRLGLVEVAGSATELRSALARALERRSAPDLGYAELPSAASFVLAEARDGAGRRQGDSRGRDDGE